VSLRCHGCAALVADAAGLQRGDLATLNELAWAKAFGTQAIIDALCAKHRKFLDSHLATVFQLARVPS
jgi:hypothetical protein